MRKAKHFAHTLQSSIQQIQRTEGHKNALALCWDIIWCGIRYGASPNNYTYFHFYELGAQARKTFLTNRDSEYLIKNYNSNEYRGFFENKLRFAERFHEYYGRTWTCANQMNYSDFVNFCDGKRKVIAKNVFGARGNGILVIDLEKYSLEECWAELSSLFKNGTYILEEWIQQHPALNEIYAKSVNCLRVVTFLDGDEPLILAGYLDIGNGTEIANGAQNAFMTLVNLEDGTCMTHFATNNGEYAVCHPDTKYDPCGFKIPFWDEIKDMLHKVILEIPQVAYVGWDIAITAQGPVIIEGNTSPGYIVYQNPTLLKDWPGELNEGARGRFPPFVNGR